MPARLLDDAGEERFRLKSDYFASRMDDELPSQVLYQGIMGALGYTKNKESFEELACRLPLSNLENFCRDKSHQEQISVLKALFLGKAGLLPWDDNEDLERIWCRVGDGEAMQYSCWRLFRVRPENHPARRLVGAAYLLARFMGVGLLEGVLSSVNEAYQGAGRLESSFMVDDPEPCCNGGCTLIGRGRAREIVVNIVLPFAFAWAEANLEGMLAERVLTLYRGYPRAGENGITRELASLLLGRCDTGLVETAQRQQGLIHLDKTFCRQRWCAACPIAQRLSGIDRLLATEGTETVDGLLVEWT